MDFLLGLKSCAKRSIFLVILFRQVSYGLPKIQRQDADLYHNFLAREPNGPPLLSHVLRIGHRNSHHEMYKDYPNNATGLMTAFNQPNEDSLLLGMTGLTNSFALEEAMKITSTASTHIDASGHCVPTVGFCRAEKVCEPVEAQPEAKCNAKKKFSNEDGSCHDLSKANLGMAGTTQLRLVPNRYSDGCDIPRKFSLEKSHQCSVLPDPRLISSTISQSVRTPEKGVSLLLTTFGQFVDHDLTLTPVFHRKHLGRPAQPLCCPYRTSTQCEPINVENDPFYAEYGITCLEFVRSIATTTDPSCGLGVRLQINQNTHWLDGSNIYGSGKTQSSVLRLLDGGFLDFSVPDGQKLQARKDYDSTFLPLSDLQKCKKKRAVNSPCAEEECCVYAGDMRAGEQPPLAAMHTLWMRHHNRVAGLISDVHPSLTDEETFQEARRIVLAQYQYIVYKELLPEILGAHRMKLYGLSVLNGTKHLPAEKYQAGQGKVLLEYSTAAGRFGHSLLHDDIYKTTSAVTTTSYALSDHLNKVDLAVSSGSDVGNLLKGQCSHGALKMDQQITGEVQNKLFKGSSPFGGDLFAINVQRGRDHGIGTYYDLRRFCLGDVSVDPSWDAPVWQGVFYPGVFDIVRKLFRSPLDVDLFVGGISEVPDVELKGLVGPTFACIIAKQFQHTKFGDRFYFEFENLINKQSQFTSGQLAEIRKSSLARLMCDLTVITTIQPDVLRTDSETVDCSDPKFMKETGVDYGVLIGKSSLKNRS